MYQSNQIFQFPQTDTLNYILLTIMSLVSSGPEFSHILSVEMHNYPAFANKINNLLKEEKQLQIPALVQQTLSDRYWNNMICI